METSRDTALDATHVGVGSGHIVLAREEQRDVDRHSRKNRLLDRRQPFLCAWDLDEEVRSPCPRMQLFGLCDGARRVVREQRRNLQRDPTVDAVRRVVDGPEEVGSLRQILDGQVKKELLIRLDLPYFLADGRIIGLALGNGMVEDGGVGGEPGDRQLVDVALERAARQQIAGDVVEPEALTGLTEL